jgi:hypothetical protein
VLAERLERAEERPLTFTLSLSTADPVRSPIGRVRRQTSRASDALERNLQDVRVPTPGRASRTLAGGRRATVTALAIRYVLSRNWTSPLEPYACNYEPEGQGERAREKPEIVEQLALTNQIRLAAHAVTLEICVGPNTASLWLVDRRASGRCASGRDAIRRRESDGSAFLKALRTELSLCDRGKERVLSSPIQSGLHPERSSTTGEAFRPIRPSDHRFCETNPFLDTFP